MLIGGLFCITLQIYAEILKNSFKVDLAGIDTNYLVCAEQE